jgi:phosphoesterase RecJ-like protein
MKKPPESLLEALRGARRLVLTSHRNPDGDALGSEIGLARLLRQLGKEVVVWNRDAYPAVYAPALLGEVIHLGPEPPPGFPEAIDAAVVLECPGLERTGLEDLLGAVPLLNIDHHLGNDGYGAEQWIDTEAPSVGAMVYRLVHALGLELDAGTADALYLTLVTDTGGFRFSNATAEAFEVAARLVKAGASPERVGSWVYESQPLAYLRMLGDMLQTLELFADGRLATVQLTHEMVERSGAAPGDAEGLIDHPRSLAGVEAVALFKEQEGGGHKVSLRSRGTLDVERVARRFGGGGHQNAAGFKSDLEGDRLRAETCRALIDLLEQNP